MTHPLRRRSALGMALALGASPWVARAQGYPDRPVRLIVPYAAGGPLDLYARLLTTTLGEKLKQAVVVDNRAGAGGVIGMSALAQAPADGYTLGIGGLPLVGSIFNRNVPYNIDTDFEPVGGVYSAPFYLYANTLVPAKSLTELVQHGKRNPGKLAVSAGSSSSLLLSELLKTQAGLDMLSVRYKGNGPALQAALRDEIQVGFDQLAPLRPHVAAGKIRLLASTGDRRSPLAPDIPTLAELGYPDLTIVSSATVHVRTSTPGAVKGRLNTLLVESVNAPSFSERLLGTGVMPYTPTMADVRQQVRREGAFWANAARLANYEPE